MPSVLGSSSGGGRFRTGKVLLYGKGFMVQDLELRVKGKWGKGPRNRFEDGGFRVEGTGFRVQGFGSLLPVSGSGFGVLDLRFRVSDQGFAV